MDTCIKENHSSQKVPIVSHNPPQSNQRSSSKNSFYCYADIIVTTLLISAFSLSPEIVNLVNERKIPFISSRPDRTKVREILHFQVDGMKCKACANNVKNNLEKVSPKCKAVVVQEESRAEILCEGDSVDPALFVKAVFETTDPPGDFIATFIRREEAGADASAKMDKLVELHHKEEEDDEAALVDTPAVCKVSS